MASGAAGGVIVDMDGTNPDGTYDLDWIYEEGTGNLDACNGATINREYVYFLTNEYPYIPRCLNGEFAQVGETGPPPDGGISAVEQKGWGTIKKIALKTSSGTTARYFLNWST